MDTQLIVKNVADKMTLFMKMNNFSMSAATRALDLDYQALYRMLKGTHLTSMESLYKVAVKMGYSFSDLVSEYVTLDMLVVENDGSIENAETVRLYAKFESLFLICQHKFFAKVRDNKFLVYYELANFDSKGVYLVESPHGINELEIESISNNICFINENRTIKKLAYPIKIQARQFTITEFKRYANFRPETYCEIVL